MQEGIWKADLGNVGPNLCLPTALKKLLRSKIHLGVYSNTHTDQGGRYCFFLDFQGIFLKKIRVLEYFPEIKDFHLPMWTMFFLPVTKLPSGVGQTFLVLPLIMQLIYFPHLEPDFICGSGFPQVTLRSNSNSLMEKLTSTYL